MNSAASSALPNRRAAYSGAAILTSRVVNSAGAGGWRPEVHAGGESADEPRGRKSSRLVWRKFVRRAETEFRLTYWTAPFAGSEFVPTESARKSLPEQSFQNSPLSARGRFR